MVSATKVVAATVSFPDVLAEQLITMIPKMAIMGLWSRLWSRLCIINDRE